MDMDVEWSKSARRRSVERGDSPMREQREEVLDDMEEGGVERAGRHRSKDRKRSRNDEKDSRSKVRERSKAGDERDRRKDDRDEREKDRSRDKARDKEFERDKHRDKGRDKERDRRDRGKERDGERERELGKDDERGRDKQRGKENGSRDRDKEREKDRAKDRDREKERERRKDREKGKEHEKDRDRDLLELEKGKEKVRDYRERDERVKDQDKDRSKDRERISRKNRDEGYDRCKDVARDEKTKLDGDVNREATKVRQGHQHEEDDKYSVEDEQKAEGLSGGLKSSATEIEERILRMKEERLKNKSSGGSEVLSWVNKSRKLEEKRNAEKEKAMQLSRIFEEQDNADQEQSEGEAATQHTAEDLAGVKVLHGIDKVIEGGAVVLTLKDQNILAGGDVNEEIDVLENVEIGEQKKRDAAYKAGKKKTGVYEDKFGDESTSEKKMLPQYDDAFVEEGLILDARGHFSGEAEKKLEELRKRMQIGSTKSQYENLNSPGKISLDYYTQEEMLLFKKPKKKKSLRKKEKLDIDALEAEAVATGLGAGDHGTRNDGKRQAMREERERTEAQMRNNAYQSAYSKADEASKALHPSQTLSVQLEEDENPVIGNDDEDLYKSLERARRLALKKQEETSGPKAVALLASINTFSSQNKDGPNPTSSESQDTKVVLTEMEEFVWGLQLDQETRKPDSEDVFMEEDEVAPIVSNHEHEDETGGWKEVKDVVKDEDTVNDKQEEIVPDETIHEPAIGKGLSGALSLLKERGSLKESVEWGGRNMDKKKSKLVGIHESDGTKDIRIERTDEFGRILTPKEAFRIISHKFHGKGPGKMKQEKRMKQFQEELKLKQMKNSDTPSLSVERMREAQARLQSPYLVLSGNVKPGQTSDPRSGFATVEKDLPGGLTPMLGDRKVEHFLGIKRKSDPGHMGPPKKPKA